MIIKRFINPVIKKNNMAYLPKIKKKITSFLRKEDGKISKEKLMKAGILITIVSVANLKNANAACSTSHSNWCPPHGNTGSHCNELGLSYSAATATGTHSHHGNHCSHSSHASHGSHGSHGSGW